MAVPGLTENHARSLLASLSYASQLIREADAVLTSAETPDPFSRYSGSLSPPQARITRDYLRRLQAQLLRVADALGLAPPKPSIDRHRALTTAMLFLDDTLEEMRGRHLRGYGVLPAHTTQVLDGVVAEAQALVHEVEAFLTGGAGDVLADRLARLPGDLPLTGTIRTMARIIHDHGLVDVRAALVLLVDRVLEDGFEVAVVGRVSSGKSSLLNALIGAPVLPTGVLPVTAFPTRVRKGPAARVHVTDATGREEDGAVDTLDQYVTEAHNPGNQKRLTRLLVEYPSSQLPDGVVFVDTPGLGSIATSGALQTFAYLPRCDHAVVLLEATAPLTDDDVGVIGYLRDAGVGTSVLASKADLLTAEDLERVLAYVTRTLSARLGAEVPVRAISTAATHTQLLRTWIEDDIQPLDREARRRQATAHARRVELLRVKMIRALESGPAGPLSRGKRDGEARLRDVRARIDHARRDVGSLPQQEAALIEAALEAAATALVPADRPATEVPAIMRRPSQDLAERISREVRALAGETQQALAQSNAAVGLPAPTLDELGLDRETPIIDMPTLPAPPGSVPLRARMTVGLRQRWMRTWLDEHWAASLRAATAAHLAVLAHWARGRLDELTREVDGHNHPLRDPRAPPPAVDRAAGMDGQRAGDLAWLHSLVAAAPDLVMATAPTAHPDRRTG